ncbi:MAG: YkgJ family cysteine cluster protein [Gemmataceae bacterium]
MAYPIRTLPVLQNWDCQATGTCCKEYRVTLSDDEVERIREQGWTRDDLGGLEPTRQFGPPWRRQVQLNHHADGSCVFLSPEGRCRIHERFGYETKPLPCRLFPFVLVPAGDHWRVGMRYACPSAAANRGRALPEHGPDLRQFADGLARREKLDPQPDGSLTPPPRQDRGGRLDWPDTLRLVDALVRLIRNGKDPVERRVRKCLYLADQMRQAKLDTIQGARLGELLDLLTSAADSETPAAPTQLPPPGWIGRILFRQAAALFTRKDHGPNRGLASRGRIALMKAALRFTRGAGSVPRLHAALPETTFEELETPRGPLPAAAEAVLERYYTVKVGSIQFCGPASFGLPFWEGFEALAVTLPLVLWVARMVRDVAPAEAVTRALVVVDDHVGFNRVLASTRQRLSFQILARTGQLSRLIAWYSR